MIYIIIGVLVISAISSVVKWVRSFVKKNYKVLLTIAFIAFSIWINALFPALLILGSIFYFAQKKKKREKAERISKNIKWIESFRGAPVAKSQANRVLDSFITDLSQIDTNNPQRKFDSTNMPYGRANAFLNFFGKNIYDEEPLYFSAVRSKDDKEFREYGIMVTDKGVYACDQGIKEKDTVKLSYLDLRGIKNLIMENGSFIGVSIDESLDNKAYSFSLPKQINSSALFFDACKNLINCGYGVACFKESYDYDAIVNEIRIKEEKMASANIFSKAMDGVGIVSSVPSFKKRFSETKGFMNGARGNGYAAEYGANTIDRLRGRKVESTAQVLDEHGRQVKGGADRTVNGQLIQTKYYKTASESIGAAFQHKQAIYTYTDQNGNKKMMAIEVPRDQYNAAKAEMQKHIDSGHVPGVEPGEDASNYVKKGYFTYSQSWNIAKAGSLEGLTVDLASGMICSSSAAGITAVIVFANALWSGASRDDAARAGASAGMRVLGKGAFVYTLSMQLSRKQIINPFLKEYTADGVYKGFAGVKNPIYEGANRLANDISNSKFASTKVGEAMGIKNVSVNSLVASGVTVIVVFGPDIVRAIDGRISGQQLFKNSVIGAGGIGGAQIGQILIPIPVVGGIIGGSIGGFVTKKIIDKFIEDDAKEMFRILKEEFIDQTMSSNLTKKEFDAVIESTIQHSDLQKILQNMYKSGEARTYARVAIMQPAIQLVLSKREKVKSDIFNSEILAIAAA